MWVSSVFLVFFLAYSGLVSRIIRESRALDLKEAAEEELLQSRCEGLQRAQSELDESLSRLETCRKRRRQLVSRGIEMTRRGLDSLEELERAEEVAAAEDVNSLVHSNIID